MKLAEALIERADAQRRIQQLQNRLARSAKVQEGEQPPENPQELLQEVDTAIAELVILIKRINRTNAITAFDDNRTLTDALAERDMLMLKRQVLNGLITSAQPDIRYGRMEIKYTATLDIADLQSQMDRLSRDYRQLDTDIQKLNWSVDLIEE